MTDRTGGNDSLDVSLGNPGGFRCGYIAFIGEPNVGKSTLLNRLMGRRLSIIARRPQTTRRRVVGILNGPDYQAMLVDTPGLLEPKYRLQELMRQEISRALRDTDVALVMLDAVHPETVAKFVGPSGHFRKVPGRALIAVNKVDMVPRERLLKMVAELAGYTDDKVYLISALKGDGIEELKAGLVAALPLGAPCYPPDMVSDRPERFFVAEFVREAVFNLYGQELPYSTTVVVDEFTERPGRKDFIRAVIYVERVTQRKIIIGRGGEALKRVGASSRRSIEEFLGRPVYLELWVKVAEDWRRDGRFIKEQLYPDG